MNKAWTNHKEIRFRLVWEKVRYIKMIWAELYIRIRDGRTSRSPLDLVQDFHGTKSKISMGPGLRSYSFFHDHHHHDDHHHLLLAFLFFLKLTWSTKWKIYPYFFLKAESTATLKQFPSSPSSSLPLCTSSSAIQLNHFFLPFLLFSNLYYKYFFFPSFSLLFLLNCSLLPFLEALLKWHIKHIFSEVKH